MRLLAFKIEQHGKPLYVTYLHASDLLDQDKIKPDVWSPNNPDGYQRSLEIHRARLFARYILNTKNISPPSILLSARGEVKFERIRDNYGMLEIPDDSALFVVDGQHRVEGIRIALRGLIRGGRLSPDFMLPVVIICPKFIDSNEAPRFIEAKQFVVINRTQKRVRVDLSDRFIAKLTDQQRRELAILGSLDILERTRAAVEIADNLNSRSDSVWHDNITLPGSTRKIISQRSFTQSLEPILKNTRFKSMSIAELAEILNEYWKAWKRLCPEAFGNPQNHVIQKTTGAFVLHKLFLEATNILDTLKLDYSENYFYEILSLMDRGNSSEYWHRDGEAGRIGTSKKAFNELAEDLKRSLNAGVLQSLVQKSNLRGFP